ncbi:MAG: hypothetical protein UR60_C0003G0003 [Candidatus Moranbacteria bacterium GW2011_GWF2_34_56]|nr:MAG: hypothetical protein UR51_C0004G0012 [Candidatus Moranbacteria bacterium GW2011_GWF1_34_10]KKP65312.1 MAG: hypothetical protein UR60_C0003G0003 [Candidatus Moranbacteria bacterium GW2011_GWF2_34_56]HBI16575.1 hypothetical protein [Candidatus Moranbacteria bacterium]
MNNKILIIIFLILIGGVAIFAYPVIKSRYFQSSQTDIKEENLSTDEETEEENDESSSADEDDSETLPDEQPVDEDVFIEIDQEDCEGGCEQFEDADDKKYCMEYCGIKSDTTVTDDCEKLEDLEKDYCWKNKAIAEKNFNFCKNIFDKKIQESCKTRLTEELLNGSNSPIE